MFRPTLHAFNKRFAIAVFIGYIGLFSVSFLLMFVFPIGSLAIVVLAIFGLLIVVPVGAGARAWEEGLNRRVMRRGLCPSCGESTVIETSTGVRCLSCGLTHDQRGAIVIVREESDETDATSPPPREQ
ncbi:MAG: hypothetical protein O2800_05335 [Planctomycetota bacterium]|nr:hypothetical protein [Planctomycetota bacterium]